MGKDREGKFHPTKGKPSGNGKEIDRELHLSGDGSLEQYLEIADKYAVDEAAQDGGLAVRHPNRNVAKGESRPTQKSSRYGTLLADRSTITPEELLTLSKESFAELANFTSSCCVSVYLPTHQAGVAVNEQRDAITFKSTLQRIQAALKAKGMEQAMIDHFLEPGYVLLKDEKFWFGLTKGLAVFMSDGYLKYFRMPFEPKEELMINTSFRISPLVPVMTQKDYFYLLTLSKKQAKLFRGDVFGLTHIPIDEMPNGVDDVVHFEEKGGQNLWRTESSGAGEGANYHGAGGGKPEEKDFIAVYLDEVEETAWKEVLHTEKAPLLLAGVEYLLPIFRQVTSYQNVWNDVLTGNHDYEDVPTLYRKALEKMTPYFQQRVQRALEDYGNHLGGDLAISLAEDIIPASYYSRVARLFAAKDEHIWGTFDEQNNVLTVHGTQEEGDECLLDKAVIQTLLHGGEVFFLEREKMPGASKLAALMRY
jgi:hypothetical protein